jgi:hypothetical protein
MAFNGKTGVYNVNTGQVYIGSFAPQAGTTAHQQLVNNAGVNPAHCMGFSIANNGNMGFNSVTLHGPQRWGGNDANTVENIMHNLQGADYKTVSPAGSVNNGQKNWDVQVDWFNKK